MTTDAGQDTINCI